MNMPTLRGGKVQALGCLLLVASVMSGKLSLDRFAGGFAASPWLEIRLWTLVAALWLLRPHVREVSQSKRAYAPFFALVALVCYLLVRGLFDHGRTGGDKVVDLLYLLVQGFLLVTASRRQLALFAMGAIACASGLFLLAALGVSQPELNGPGWAPIGGPTTFYRIEFLAFCLCWGFYGSLGSRYWPLALCSGFFLFGSLASLSKVALPGAVVVLVIFGIRLFALRNWRGLACLAVAAVGALFAWQLVLGDAMRWRLERAATMINPPKADANCARPSGSDAAAPADCARPRVGTDFEVTIHYCLGVQPGLSPNAGDPENCVKRVVVDRSSRLVFVSEAIRGIVERPFWGHGLATFELHFPNPDAGFDQTYLYPHNLLLDVAYDGGVVGLGLLLIALALAFRSGLQATSSDPAAIYLLGFMVFVLLSALATGDVYDSRLLWLTGFALLGRPGRA